METSSVGSLLDIYQSDITKHGIPFIVKQLSLKPIETNDSLGEMYAPKPVKMLDNNGKERYVRPEELKGYTFRRKVLTAKPYDAIQDSEGKMVSNFQGMYSGARRLVNSSGAEMPRNTWFDANYNEPSISIRVSDGKGSTKPKSLLRREYRMVISFGFDGSNVRKITLPVWNEKTVTMDHQEVTEARLSCTAEGVTPSKGSGAIDLMKFLGKEKLAETYWIITIEESGGFPSPKWTPVTLEDGEAGSLEEKIVRLYAAAQASISSGGSGPSVETVPFGTFAAESAPVTTPVSPSVLEAPEAFDSLDGLI